MSWLTHRNSGNQSDAPQSKARAALATTSHRFAYLGGVPENHQPDLQIAVVVKRVPPTQRIVDGL